MRVIIVAILALMLFTPGVFSDVYNIRGGCPCLKAKVLYRVKKWQQDIVKTAIDNKETIIINGPRVPNKVYLTFDDGPHKRWTPRILAILKKNFIRASFFFVGQNATKNKNLVKKAFAEGHAVFSHSWSHPRFSRENQTTIKTEVTRTENLLNSLLGKRSLLMRPPYGDINEGRGLQVLRLLGYKVILWSLDSFDWAGLKKEAIVDNVINHVRPGEIILMHSKEETCRALPTIIKKLKEQGYSFATVDSID